MSSISPADLGAAAAWLAGGVAVGLVLRWLFGVLERRSDRSRWAADEIVFGALREAALVIGIIAGLWAATLALPPGVRTTTWTGRVLLGVAVGVVTIVVARAAGRAVGVYAGRIGGLGQSTTLFVNITRLVVVLIGFLILLQSFGVSIAPLLTALGVGGLAVALALQDTLSNLFAGVHILASKKVRPGDFVQLDSGEEGYITDINWRNTSIRQLPNNLVIVPNARLASSIVTNFHRPERELAVLVPVGVAYDSDLQEVERTTVDVAGEVMREVEGGVPEFEPFIRYHTFNESSIDFTVILRAKEFTDQYPIKHEFVKRLQARYRRDGIEIPFPIRTVVLRPGEAGDADGGRPE